MAATREPLELGDGLGLPSDGVGQDGKAAVEARMFNTGDDLEKDGKTREHNRYQSFRDHANVAAIMVFWTVVLMLLWGVVVYAAHMLMPNLVNFLSEKQLSRLESLLGTALLSSALTGYVNKRMTD
ncbi:hypothetical protein [Delftia sp. RIT313]|uniref:hypothetical protein n=1 Tax=Delftia sp. RIT313 TaxID=1468410 RepID=UPI0012693675|nr:hypothetical protein [Delftia sp. RIT313]